MNRDRRDEDEYVALLYEEQRRRQIELDAERDERHRAATVVRHFMPDSRTLYIQPVRPAEHIDLNLVMNDQRDLNGNIYNMGVDLAAPGSSDQSEDLSPEDAGGDVESIRTQPLIPSSGESEVGPGPCPKCGGPTKRALAGRLLYWQCEQDINNEYNTKCGGYRPWNVGNKELV